MPLAQLKPYWQTTDHCTVRLYRGHVCDVLRRMPRRSVQMVVTSPPYWGLRDYGTAEWVGGSSSCDHNAGFINYCVGLRKMTKRGGPTPMEAKLTNVYKDKCKRCGAKRVDTQIGSEPTPEDYITTMVEVFEQVWRVLRDDGTVWLNMGDNYGKQGLYGMPWRLALALQEYGWILRQDIIWSKPSPMPESVKNRCTKAHEYLFLLVKGKGYYYDNEAVKENAEYGYSYWHDPDNHVAKSVGGRDGDPIRSSHTVTAGKGGSRNKRSVWTIASESYAGAHFATFPRKLITPCILAGTSAHGCCARCGTPYRRVTKETKLTRKRPNKFTKRTGKKGTGNFAPNDMAGVDVKTVKWVKGCKCSTSKVIPCTVLDIFVGSGTTCCVALANGRRSIGIDLSRDYLANNAIPRIEGELLQRPKLAHLAGRSSKKVRVGSTLKST